MESTARHKVHAGLNDVAVEVGESIGGEHLGEFGAATGLPRPEERLLAVHPNRRRVVNDLADHHPPSFAVGCQLALDDS